MFGFLKRKKTSLTDHVIKLERNKNIDFQLDVIRDGNPDFQLIRQRMLKGFDSSVNIKYPKGFAFLISFNLNTPIGKENHKKFKKSSVFKDSEKLNIPDEDIVFYTIQTNNNSHEVLVCVNKIQTEVYGYTEDTYYYFKYKEI